MKKFMKIQYKKNEIQTMNKIETKIKNQGT